LAFSRRNIFGLLGDKLQPAHAESFDDLLSDAKFSKQRELLFEFFHDPAQREFIAQENKGWVCTCTKRHASLPAVRKRYFTTQNITSLAEAAKRVRINKGRASPGVAGQTR
jgi:hypothetical protein